MFKKQKSPFETPFGDLKVGKPVIDFIFVMIELFSLSFTVISGNLSTSAFFEESGSL